MMLAAEKMCRVCLRTLAGLVSRSRVPSPGPRFRVVFLITCHAPQAIKCIQVLRFWSELTFTVWQPGSTIPKRMSRILDTTNVFCQLQLTI